ncbi:complement receptor type 2 isoform X2 [Pseudorasbora parva]|uniref:complement receptor type 2 isoform X2 n=1 Tax=Pseudorasbora parva TaxID=51549 RepID=UPI00351E3DC7
MGPHPQQMGVQIPSLRLEKSVNMATVWGNILILVFAHFVVSQTHNKCGEPTKYLHKQLQDKYLLKTVFNEQEIVTYKCAPGYSYSGGTKKSQCRQGQWTTLNMNCERKKCYALGEIENGRYNQKGRSFGDKAVAVCNKGYVLRGEKVRMCMENGWNGTDPICEEPKIFCSAPAVANRWVKPGERTQYTPQDTVTIICSKGFDLIGSSVVTCGSGGQWLNLPECRPEEQKIFCSAPAVANRLVKPGERTQYEPQDTVTIICKEGFDLIGSSVVTCGADGQWLNLPECRPQVIHCSAPTVANGEIDGFRRQYKPKDKVDVQCHEGFDMSGPPQVTCGPDGQWQGLPECRPKRISATAQCGPAPSYPYMDLRDWSSMLKEYPSGARIRYKCGVGYRRVRGSDSIRCQGGQWTKLLLQCERKRCGSAGEISYGRFEYTGVLFGHSAKAICQEGYELIGKQMLFCRDGGWDGRIPVCEPVHCPPPPEVKGAEMSEPTYDFVPYGRAVSYHCHTGALIGSRDIYCTKKGTWSAPPPECKDITCPHPHVSGGSGMRGFRAVYKFRNTVTITCRPGLRLIGESFVTCGPDGKWEPKLPECVQRY